MLKDFATVLVFAIISFLFVFLTLLVGKFLRPNNPTPIKGEPYECGEPAVGGAWINFNIRFYMLALIFVIFDVEAALIFPAAAVFKRLVMNGRGIIALFEVLIFVAVLIVGLVYVWVKRDLEWVKKV